MTATCSSVAIIKHDFHFFMSETSMKDSIYTSTIQSVVEYEIVPSPMTYTMMLITRSKCGTLQSMEIDKHISIPRVKIHDQNHVSFDRRLIGYNIA
jgi:hypothetical protein